MKALQVVSEIMAGNLSSERRPSFGEKSLEHVGILTKPEGLHGSNMKAIQHVFVKIWASNISTNQRPAFG